jgi:hypothetical protein
MNSDRPSPINAAGRAETSPERLRTRIGFARRWVEWRPRISSWHFAETILLSVLALALTYWLRPSDPLSLTGGFPWAWLAPVMLALRYSIRSGLISVGLLLVGWILISGGEAGPVQFTTPTVLGGLILTLVCGEFSGLWRLRLRRQTEMNQYLAQRLQELTRQHYLIKLSHDQLEENLIARPYTLRGALIELRAILERAHEDETLPGVEAFMTLMATHCHLTVAGLFPVRGGRLANEPIAVSGQPGKLEKEDMLVAHALEQHSLVHVNQEHFRDNVASRYLVAVPIYRHGELAGMLAVEQMPFFAFHHETLQTLVALISYFSDGYLSDAAKEVLTRFPDCPRDFALNLERLSRVHQVSAVASHLVAMSFPDNDRGRSIRQRLIREKRELDFYWLRDQPRTLLVALFPLTGEGGVQGFLARVDVWLEAEFGNDHRGLGIQVEGRPIALERVVDQLQAMIEHGR